MEFPESGRISYNTGKIVEWLVDENTDQAISPEFLINNTVRSKLTLLAYKKSISQKGKNNGRMVLMVQLLMSPDKADIFENIELIIHSYSSETNVTETLPLRIKPYPMIETVNYPTYLLPHLSQPINSFRKIKIQCNIIYKENQEASISDKYEDLFESNLLTDLTIVASGTEFKVHKAILSAQSEVFAAMLEDHTKESKEGKIEIDDVDADVMREILRFIYSGKIKDSEKLALYIIVPADKYGIVDLITICQNVVSNNISLDNIKDILSLVDLIDLKLLKINALDFVADNQEALKTKDFMDFSENLSPSLLNDINKILHVK